MKFPCFLFGLGVGAAFGLLYAPRPGVETREELQRRREKGREFLRRRGGELREQADDILGRGRGVVQTQRDQLAAALDAGRRAYREATGQQGEDSADNAAEAAAAD